MIHDINRTPHTLNIFGKTKTDERKSLKKKFLSVDKKTRSDTSEKKLKKAMTNTKKLGFISCD